MKRIIIVIFLGLLISSCGARRKAKLKVTSSKVEITINKTSKPEPSKNTPVTNNALDYISYYKSISISEMYLYGIPASITLAQGILESGSGKARLARDANNHFGIKCHDWKGARVYHDDDKAQECFRKYKDPSQSFRDHSEFLANRKRYAGLFKLKKDDYKGWAKGLRKAGYATDPKYPQKLISLIERYELYKYDVKSKKSRTKNESSSPSSKVQYTVKKGDTLYSISRLYNTTVDAIKQQNNLRSTALTIGQQLIISSN
ncbi:glucosaminidase domain-containing protein [Flavobacteriaceae bacterium]|jgi:flagellum-specific peptidoglycan hydrolase FlgJ|nr:glucosaminidase domain-containing protein [Flavobacteriaceae bacterium]